MKALRLHISFYKIIISIFFMFSLLFNAQAQENRLELTGPIDSAGLVGSVDYFLDDTTSLSITDITSDDIADKFQTVDSEFIDFGFTKSAIWFRLQVENKRSENDRWMLYFKENFFPEFRAYQTDGNGKIITITEQVESSGFDARPVAHPFLVVPARVQAGEVSDIYIKYRSGGASEIRFSIETQDSYNQIAASKNTKNSIFYGMLILLFMISAAVFLYARRAIFFAYAASTLCSLLIIMHFDGTAFQYVWPGLSIFNNSASLYLGMSSLFFGAMFAREFLQTRRYHGFVDKVLLGIMLFSAVSIASSAFIDHQFLKWGLVLMAPFTYLWFLIAGINAARTRFKEVRFYVVAWAGVFISSIGLMAREILGIDLSEELQWDSMRVVMVGDAAFMGLGLLDRYNQIRIASQENMRASLTQARRNLKLTQRLNDLEKQFETVSNIAQSKDQQISNTVHDLRQPLHALRLKVHDIMQGNNDDSKNFDDVTQNFSYLESLISDHLTQAAEGAEIIGSSAEIELRDESEDEDGRAVLSTDSILSSVYEMFQPEAEEKGLALEYHKTDHELDVDSLVLMRIASNLVSNAIKYTKEGKVSFGLVKDNNKIRFEVVDTGVGMTAEQFEAAMAANVRLKEGADQAEGNGFGLSIIKELAEKHGLALSLSTQRERGTGIFVDFPTKLA